MKNLVFQKLSLLSFVIIFISCEKETLSDETGNSEVSVEETSNLGARTYKGTIWANGSPIYFRCFSAGARGRVYNKWNQYRDMGLSSYRNAQDTVLSHNSCYLE